MIKNYWAIRQDFERTRPYSVYIFIGEEDYLKDLACQAIAQRFLGRKPDGNSLRVIYASEVEGTAVVEQCLNLGLFQEKQVLVVKEADSFSSKSRKALLQYVANPSPDTCLILISNKPDERNSWVREFEEQVEIIKFLSLEGEQLIRWLISRARERGLEMGEEAAEALIVQSGNRLGVLDAELEKINNFLLGNKGKIIDRSLVMEMAGHTSQASPEELYHTISLGDKKRSLMILQRLLEAGEDPMKLAAGYYYRIEKLWKVSLASRGSTLSNGLDRSTYYALKKPEVRRLSRKRDDKNYIQALMALYDMERRVKSGQGDAKTLAYCLVDSITDFNSKKE